MLSNARKLDGVGAMRAPDGESADGECDAPSVIEIESKLESILKPEPDLKLSSSEELVSILDWDAPYLTDPPSKFT